MDLFINKLMTACLRVALVMLFCPFAPDTLAQLRTHYSERFCYCADIYFQDTRRFLGGKQHNVPVAIVPHFDKRVDMRRMTYGHSIRKRRVELQWQKEWPVPSAGKNGN